MFRVRLALVSAALVVCATAPLPAVDPPPELRKLHALLVVDTRAGLGESVVIDGERIRHLLVRGIPRDRLELTVFKDKDVTAAKVLDYYKTRKVGRTDALFLFYAGHGATDPQKGHFLAFQELNTKPLLRSDLIAAMQAHSPGLAVVVTDCCSTRFKLPKSDKAFRAGPADHPGEVDPVLRCLFFQHRGVVDVTAATDNSAFGDDQHGGLFTRSFVDTLTKKGPGSLDTNRDGFVSWAEVFPRVQAETEKVFERWAGEARGHGQTVDQKTQRPRAFALADGGAADQAVKLVNASDKRTRYQYRWEGETAWETKALAPKESATHPAPAAKAGKDAPRLEVKFENGETGLLKPGKTYKYSDDKK